MQVRAKFRVESKDTHGFDTGDIGNVILRPVYSDDPNHENKKFWDATPSGTIQMYITNPAAFAAFGQGKECYVDFTFDTEVPVEHPCTERTYNGTKDVFYLQVIDPTGKVVANNKHGDAFPAPCDLERALVAATAVYGHNVEVKVDKRTALNYVDVSVTAESACDAPSVPVKHIG